MPVATLATLDDVHESLKRHLGSNQMSLGPICTRVMLRTGVNVREPQFAQNTDPAVVAKVIAVLADMGFAL